MTGIGRSPNRWVSALIAVGTMVSSGAGTALASPASPLVEFSSVLSTHQAAVTEVSVPPHLVSPGTIPVPIAYTVCSESATWARPNTAEQTSHLQSNPRYGSTSLPGETQAWLQSFWEKNVITFTTYGLSARQEPIYFSGLWSLLEQEPVWEECYTAERISQINTGQVAELWLIGHQIQSMQWVDDRYVITVEPTEAGVQFVQFPRQETSRVLPLQVITEDNVPLEFVSADYSTQL